MNTMIPSLQATNIHSLDSTAVQYCPEESVKTTYTFQQIKLCTQVTQVTAKLVFFLQNIINQVQGAALIDEWLR